MAIKWSRLTKMSWDEVWTRSRQQLSKGSDALRYKVGIGFEIPVDSSNGLEHNSNFFFSRDEIPALTRCLLTRHPEVAAKLVESADKICSHRFDLLGYRDLDYGQEIRWHTDVLNGVTAPHRPWHQIRYLDFSEVGDAKVTWELNRHQHFSVLARAYLVTRNKKYLDELNSQWCDWNKSNPYPIGINWASSLEVAFRSLSWIWVYHLLDQDLSPERKSEIVGGLAINGRHIETYLSTYFSANTHLLGEAVALFFIGTLFPQIAAAAQWKQLGWEIILDHARSKVLNDGAYFEQSTYYHVYALDFILHARNLAAKNQVEIPADFDHIIQKMLSFLAALHQGGPPPRFGDDDGGRLFDGRRNRVEHLSDPLSIGAVVYGNSNLKLQSAPPSEELLWLLGETGLAQFDQLPTSQRPSSSLAFKDTGAYVMSSGVDASLVIDAGPLGGDSGGHGHADALSVNLSAEGRQCLVDPGAFIYVGGGTERAEFRSTGMHNTLQLDGLSQAVPKTPFAWEAMPRSKVDIWISGDSFDLFAGKHDGYLRLGEGVLHRRWVFNLKSRYWLICDVAVGSGSHSLNVAWHLAPGYSIQQASEIKVIAEASCGPSLSFQTSEDSAYKYTAGDYYYSAAYGDKEKAIVVRHSGNTTLPSAIASLITLSPKQNPNQGHGRLYAIHSADQSLIQAFRYEQSDYTDFIFFAFVAKKPWRIDEWSSDAEFLYCRVEEHGTIRKTIACDGSWAEWNGAPVFKTDKLVRCHEANESR